MWLQRSQTVGAYRKSPKVSSQRVSVVCQNRRSAASKARKRSRAEDRTQIHAVTLGHHTNGATNVTMAQQQNFPQNDDWGQDSLHSELTNGSSAELYRNYKKQGFDRLRVFAGTSNPALAKEVASNLGMDLSPIKIKRFADGEIYVAVEESIRGCDVFLIQPTCPPVNDHLMELCVMIDACRRASAKSITAVVPYFGYARADRKTQGRESIAAKLVANLLTEAGADRLLAMDLHSGQCVGYFDIPVDHVHGDSVLLEYLTSKRISTGELVVVSPDVGGVHRARQFAKQLNDAPLAIVDKRRSAHNVSEVMNVIGEVKDKIAVLVDDMIDTAGTIHNAAKVIKAEGAKEIYVCATHAVFSPPATQRLSDGVFQEVIVTNTIPIHPTRNFPQLTVLTVAGVIADTIFRMYDSSAMRSATSKDD